MDAQGGDAIRSTNVTELKDTGERFIPGHGGIQIHFEHVQRYTVAAELVPLDGVVLDYGSGAGYGSALLAERAARVIGVDVAADAVASAAQRYARDNIEFRCITSCTVPLPDKSVDLIVCFEVLEHIYEQQRLLCEFGRLLKDQGICLISTPNRIQYSDRTGYRNPFHVAELTFEEFDRMLSGEFQARAYYRQRFAASALFLPVERLDGTAITESRIDFTSQHDQRGLQLPENVAASPVYYVAICSRGSLPERASQLGRLIVDESNVAFAELAGTNEHLKRHIMILEGGVAERDQLIQEQQDKLRALTDRTAAQEAELHKLTASLRDHRERDERLTTALRERALRNNALVSERDHFRRTLPPVLDELALVKQSGTWRIAQAMSRFTPSWTKRAYRKFKGSIRIPSQVEAQTASADTGRMRISIVVPIFNHAAFLRPMLDSLCRQTIPADEVILVDDCSTDPQVAVILNEYRGRPGFRVMSNTRNSGISATLNAGIMVSTGHYIAFVDCDDILTPDAIELVRQYLSDEPAVDFLYTNRIDIDEDGKKVWEWDFTNRATDPVYDALMIGMFTSHLKVVRSACLLDVGLYDPRYDLSQDYDLALRMAERFRFGHMPRFIYHHRIHQRQQTQQHNARQESHAERIRADSRRRQSLRNGSSGHIVSIIMLTLNRPEITKRAIEKILANVTQPYELILFDNGSRQPTLDMLTRFTDTHEHIRLIRGDQNYGVSGGRLRAARHARGDFLFFLDSDILIEDSQLLVKLMERLETEPKAAAACCKVVFPNDRIQFNGGSLQRRNANWLRFGFVDSDKSRTDLSAMQPIECEWIPGGATMWRRSFYDQFPPHDEMLGAFEDNETCLRIRKAGVKLLNCPTAVVYHYHHMFRDEEDKDYLAARYNRQRILASLRVLHRDHGVFVDDPDLYEMLGYPQGDPNAVIQLGLEADPAGLAATSESDPRATA